jgi:hypothetical protein
MTQSREMDSVDHALALIITRLQSAIPDPVLWAGAASDACAQSIEKLTWEFAELRKRLKCWAI